MNKMTDGNDGKTNWGRMVVTTHTCDKLIFYGDVKILDCIDDILMIINYSKYFIW